MENFVKRLRFKWWLLVNRRKLQAMEPLFGIIAIMEKEAQIYGDTEAI